MGEAVELLIAKIPVLKGKQTELEEFESSITPRVKKLHKEKNWEDVIFNETYEFAVGLLSGMDRRHNGLIYCEQCNGEINKPRCWPDGIIPVHNCAFATPSEAATFTTPFIRDPLNESITEAEKQTLENRPKIEERRKKLARALEIKYMNPDKEIVVPL